MIDKVKQGKQNRFKGAAFERKVRKHLESMGWICDKWTNNVQLEDKNSLEVSGRLGGPFGKLVPARTNRFNSRSCGFPDFVCFGHCPNTLNGLYDVMAVECKVGKYLNKEEKAKVQWYFDNKIFGRI